jgi:hypothetical protein
MKPSQIFRRWWLLFVGMVEGTNDAKRVSKAWLHGDYWLRAESPERIPPQHRGWLEERFRMIQRDHRPKPRVVKPIPFEKLEKRRRQA